MVKKRDTHDIWYNCEKCHSNYDTLEEAEECENQEPTMKLLRGESYKEDVVWKVGDFLLVKKEERWPDLVRIVEPTEIRHKIWPRLEHLRYGGKVYNYNGRHTTWVRVVTDNIREVILGWAKELEGVK